MTLTLPPYKLNAIADGAEFRRAFKDARGITAARQGKRRRPNARHSGTARSPSPESIIAKLSALAKAARGSARRLNAIFSASFADISLASAENRSHNLRIWCG